MILMIVLGLLVALVLGAAIALYEGGIFVCEDTAMMKVALGSFFALYAVTAVGLKLFLPPVPSNEVSLGSLTSYWSDAYTGLEAGLSVPEPLARLFRPAGSL